MLKRIFFLFLTIGSLSVNAQIESIGSKEYGRLFDFTYHPTAENVVFATTAYNHILKSDNNGESWNLFYTFPEKLTQITKLKILGNDRLSFVVHGGSVDLNNNSIYVLDINSGTLIMQYNAPIPVGSTTINITSYDIYQSNPNILIVQEWYEIGLGVEARVYYSNNAGNSWSEIYYNVTNNGIFPSSVAISPSNPSKLFMCRVGGFDPNDWGGLLISDDAGQTWTEKMSGIEFDALEFHPINSSEILLGSRYDTLEKNLYRSLDNGDTWTVAIPNYSSYFEDGILNITYNKQNPNKCIFYTPKDIVVTDDNFTTFTQYNHPNGETDANSYYFGYSTTFNPFNSDEIFISNNNYPFFSSNFGGTLQKIETTFSSNNGKTEVVENNLESHLYYGIQNGFIHVNNLSNIVTPISVVPITNYVNFSSSHFFDKNRIGRTYSFNFGFSGASMVFSNDHGENIGFTAISNQFLHTVDSSPNNTNIVWASFSNDFEHSELINFNVADLDNIQQTPINLPESGIVLAIAHDQFNEGTKIIALNSKIYFTNDNGLTWEERSAGLDDLLNSNGFIFSIFKDPSDNNKILLGTSNGVYQSNNYGINWSQILTGLVTHKVICSPSNPNVIIAISNDSAISELTIKYTEDGGASWSTITSGQLEYIYASESTCQFTPTSAIVYINTTDLGLVKYEIELNSLSNPNFDQNNDFIVSPNPAREFITVVSNSDSLVSTLSIYDMSGKKIKDISNQQHIDISSLENGIYLIKIVSTENVIEYHKIVKE
ncbi:VPS10 domain-containing protein [Flavobacterium sedimenticola]|uniref:T9SS type A sorting domain-containing protein n=1 Tax=Flavobacterium sedimenticola TaxID=3043286 RepID=A0ABT6XSX1_9FLAO|nr:T9SS type A sorting domain-containing protein [Flavobacterium sedimenticola]MDI9257897.1 T9SS type A sorting domain-containing protein [Flavobacterium sedimenticola]